MNLIVKLAIKFTAIIFATSQIFSLNAHASDYWITQLRAAPGHLPQLINTITHTDWVAMGQENPVMMRHSQGDHWDIMLVGNHKKSCDSDACMANQTVYQKAIDQHVDYDISFTATSDLSWSDFRERSNAAGLFHIEMFHADAGKKDALMKQRIMENQYLENTSRKANAIFQVGFGSDVDNFTIGFYKNMQEFAHSPDLSDEEFEKQAVAAGFKNRDDISFLLRELINSHHDTIAGHVKY